MVLRLRWMCGDDAKGIAPFTTADAGGDRLISIDQHDRDRSFGGGRFVVSDTERDMPLIMETG